MFETARVQLQPAALEPLLEAEEACQIPRMSARHLLKLAREGKIPAHPRPSATGQRRRWLFLASELYTHVLAKVNSAGDPGREPRSLK
jgi:hypothetical protein